MAEPCPECRDRVSLKEYVDRRFEEMRHAIGETTRVLEKRWEDGRESDRKSVDALQEANLRVYEARSHEIEKHFISLNDNTGKMLQDRADFLRKEAADALIAGLSTRVATAEENIRTRARVMTLAIVLASLGAAVSLVAIGMTILSRFIVYPR